MLQNLRSLVAVSLLLTSAVFGQTQSATLRGSVKDASGALVPNATLTLTNVDQNRASATTANDSGEYVFVQILPGRYTLEVTANGFKKYRQNTFRLEVAQVASYDVVLDVGAVTETIEVKTDAPLLEAASSTLGEVVNSLTAESLPLNGRNVLQLVALTPGINTTPSNRSNAVGSGSIASNAFSANGGRDVSSSILVDGSPQEVMGYNQPAYVPNPDSVQEFKVQTNNLAAEYGRTGGAVVNLVTRPGGQQFHGVLFEFLRNNSFDANGFFNNLNGRSKGPFRYNQFGGTAGGPLTRSRQRSFFFFSYEGIRQVNPGSSFFSVPTSRMRAGDFSEVPNLIYDPASINAAGERSVFPNRQIPASRLSPVGQKVLSFYPTPTLPGVANNFFSQRGGRPSDNAYSARVDHRFTDRHNIFGRVSWNDRAVSQPNHFGNAASPGSGQDGSVNRSATLDDTYLAGQWVIHANLGYAYAANPRSALDFPNAAAALGMPSAIDANSQFGIFPRIDPSAYSSIGSDPTWVIGNKFETYTATGDAVRLVGRHTFKMGGTYRLNKASNFRPNSPAGQYSFNENWTRRFFNQAGGGDSIATMLLGYVQGGALRQEPALSLVVPYVALYFQDDWRVTDRLTLNLGLRWDGDRPLRERHNRASSFDLNAPQPTLAAAGLGPLTGGLVFTGRNGASNLVRNGDNNNFAPRFGLAYQLTKRIVIRTGAGIFYQGTTGIGPSANTTGALSFNAITNVISSNDGGRTPVATLANPFPAGFNRADNGALGAATFLGQGLNANLRGERTPYAGQWNFDVQMQAKNNLLFDVAYAGNAGVKLLAQADLNQLPDRFLALGDGLNDVVANPFRGLIPATTALGGATLTRGQLLRPYPQFLGVTQTWGSQAHSSYHGLQTKMRKRFANGLQFLAAYTWSKTIDDTSSVAGFLGQQNPDYTNNNRKDLDKSISGLHTGHRFVANFQYDLPFGRGKRFLTAVHPIVNGALGGWNVSGIATLQSGLPISVSSNQNLTFSYGGDARPDSTGLKSATPGSTKDRINRWIDPAAFRDAPRFAFGTVGRFLPDNFGPSLQNWDLSLLKNIALPKRESLRLQFRGEFFNLFNHANFNNPGNTAFGLTATGALARPDFGRITGTQAARVVQFGLKLYY
ncbi:MAG: carboxypeptidase regulatory-like domain-containing protein [Bryobacteraceae bacterium]|nr:carboxypeptidase regulatory-like domain-containing protein [Bryobacteraceae bacterium]